jgi:hypothetical protein
MGGGAWPFLVGRVIRLVNSDNERDLGVLNRRADRLIGCSGCARFRIARSGSGLPVNP